MSKILEKVEVEYLINLREMLHFVAAAAVLAGTLTHLRLTAKIDCLLSK